MYYILMDPIHVNVISIISHTQSGSTPLHAASDNGYNDIVKKLIQNGADINLLTKVWR